MDMKITFLGTGGAFTRYATNYHNNALVQTATGYVLIDCGGTAVESMKELGIHPEEVAGVVVTHLHGDHVGGLEQLIWERFYTSKAGRPGFRQTTIYTAPTLVGSIRQVLEPMVDEYTDCDGVARAGGYDALVTVVAPGAGVTVAVGGVHFRLCRTPHVVGPGVDKPAYGVEVGLRTPTFPLPLPLEPSFYYTSDTTFRPDIGSLYPDAKVIFHDCTFYPKYPGTVHTHYEDLLTLPPEVRARIVLMHYTSVPPGVDPVADGFRGAARRHESFSF
jgi:ribonuclease BN (tRNA processing enzyme)